MSSPPKEEAALRAELHDHGVGLHQMHGRFTNKPIGPHHRFGPNVEAGWTRSSKGGRLEIVVPEGEPLELRYVEHRHRNGDATSQIGTLSRAGVRLEVEEIWDEVSVLNNGTFRRHGTHRGERFCCDELVRASKAPSGLRMVDEGARWVYDTRFIDDVAWHDLDLHRTWVRLTVDPVKGQARLRRIAFHDASQ